ncbi:uncharacterized protein LOC116251197 isoform X2 [Nymphaea colorata]|nr:uncharacterized protein LOC116251197 isoform X1 [Nymphaea colorata]XP_049932863.1 uncharacterized protein LOC116251197 isoform X2 [Nymphaea colorata]
MAVSSFMAPKREKPSASSITRKEMSPLNASVAASDEKMEWSHFIGVGGKGLSAISILTPGCSNSNQPSGEIGRFCQEARALLGWLSTRGNYAAPLQVFRGIDIQSLIPKMTKSIADKVQRQKARFKSQKVQKKYNVYAFCESLA